MDRPEHTAPAWLLAVVLASLWSCRRAPSDADADTRVVVLEGNETAVASRRMLHTEAKLASTRDPAAAASLPDTQYVLSVPASALDWAHTPPVVTAIRNGEAVQVEVEVSIVDEAQGLAGIRSGLKPNDRVVIDPDPNLTPGTPVRIDPSASDGTSRAIERCAERRHARAGKTRGAQDRVRGALQRERPHHITAKLPAACLSPPPDARSLATMKSPRSEAI